MTATYAKFTLQLNTITDADVIEYLKAQANKNDTIRRALRVQVLTDRSNARWAKRTGFLPLQADKIRARNGG